MSAIWYCVSKYSQKIDPVEVTKFTDNSVWTIGWNKKERRRNRKSEYANYFQTWQEAHGVLLNRCSTEVVHCKRALELAESYLGNVKGMKAP